MNASSMLASILVGGDAACLLTFAPRRPFAILKPLRASLDAARAEEYVVFGIALDLPLVSRLGVLATLRWQRRRIERAIERAGGRTVAWFGLDPSFNAFACVFELDTPAAAYAERYLRPRGAAPWLRRLLQFFSGCDPALGGIVVVSRKA
jgi:hypothetical protein